MKTIRILALHLAYGGVEKAICSMANLFVQRYPVEIISVYDMPNAPAYPLDERVKVRYLLKDRPNQKEWHAALRSLRPIAFLRESLHAVKVLAEKKMAIQRTIWSSPCWGTPRSGKSPRSTRITASICATWTASATATAAWTWW